MIERIFIFISYTLMQSRLVYRSIRDGERSEFFIKSLPNQRSALHTKIKMG